MSDNHTGTHRSQKDWTKMQDRICISQCHICELKGKSCYLCSSHYDYRLAVDPAQYPSKVTE